MYKFYYRAVALTPLVRNTILIATAAALVGCSSNQSPPAATTTSVNQAPAGAQSVKETQTGVASFISQEFQGKQTASGEVLDQGRMVAAHPSYPMNTLVRVTNLENNRAVEVRIIDRGQAAKGKDEPGVIDLSRAAAEQLGFVNEGKARVRIDVLEWGGERR